MSLFENIPKDDFIEELKQSILKSHPTEPLWAEACAIAILNSIVGRFITTTTQYGSIKTNLNFLTIGMSGLNKTNPTRYFIIPILRAFDILNKTDTIRVERWSVEGLYNEINETNYGIIIREEFSSIFKDIGKGYLGDTLEVFSELYDGMAKRRRTIKGGLVQTKEVWISAIGSTTPYIFSLMNRDYFVQGTGNRFGYIMNKTQPKLVDEDAFMFPNSFERSQEIEKFVSKLTTIYTKIKDKSIYAFFVTHNIAKFKNEMTTKVIEFNKANDTLAASYYNRAAEFAIKFAMLKGIGRNPQIKDMDGFESYIVSEEDQLWAIQKTREFLKHFETLRLEWRISPDRPRAKSDEETIEYVLQILRDVNRPLGADEWCKLCHMKWNNWKPIVETLLGINAVEFLDKKYQIKIHLPTDSPTKKVE